MADVRGFRGLRYRLDATRDASTLLAPPYDVIEPDERARLAARSPHNAVHVDLPEVSSGDRYATAGERYRQWLRDGVLVRDAVPTLTVKQQTFTGPDGTPVTRKGLIAAVRLEPFDRGIILPHEHTLSGPKEDRLRLFQACGATASQVFCVYDDPDHTVDQLLARATVPELVAQSDDGVAHAVWTVSDPAILAEVHAFFASRTLLIADGHHRYETMLHYRDLQRAARGAATGPADFAPIYLANMADPGTVVYPIHRLVRDLPGFSLPLLVDRLSEWFMLTPVAESGLRPVRVAMHHAGPGTLGVLLPTGRGFTLRLRDDVRESALAALPSTEPLRSTDVSVLHGLVLERVLGVGPAQLAAQTNLDYAKQESLVEQKLASGAYQLALLLRPTDPRVVHAVALTGARMPQKSTYFFPKILTGVVTYDLEDSGVG